MTLELITNFSEHLKFNWNEALMNNSNILYINKPKNKAEVKQSQKSKKKKKEVDLHNNVSKIKNHIISQVRNLLYKVPNLNKFVSKRFTFDMLGDQSNNREIDRFQIDEGKF